MTIIKVFNHSDLRPRYSNRKSQINRSQVSFRVVDVVTTVARALVYDRKMYWSSHKFVC